MANDAWMFVPPTSPPTAGALHVWIAELDWSEHVQATFWNSLCAEEQERARRFRFPDLGRRFIAAHGILRNILGRYCGVEPRALQFGVEEHGKPVLAGNGAGLHFSLSHAGALAAYAFSPVREVGVDVERIHRVPELQAIADYHFTRREREFIAAHLPEFADRAFLTCWTRKEAYIKAIGRGLSVPLSSFDTFIGTGRQGRLLPPDDRARSDGAWWLADLPEIAGYTGAVVVNGDPPREPAYYCWTSEDTARRLAGDLMTSECRR